MGFVVWFSLLILPCFAGQKTLPESIRALEARLRPFGTSYNPGVAAAVLKGRQVIYRKAYGQADLQRRAPLTTETRFELASVSKQFTALAILQLRDKGLFSLDDQITRFLPELSSFAYSITIRHLLQHTGGLPDYTGLCEEGRPIRNSDVLLKLAKEKSVLFPAGQRYRYSNTGYSMLATLVERASGTSFPDYLRTHVFLPAGMKDSFVNTHAVPPYPRIARSYGSWPAFEPMTSADILDCNTVYGDGSLFSSLDDMIRWNLALDDNRLLSAASLAEAFQPGAANDGTPILYGFGWSLEPIAHRKTYTHGGSWAGYSHHVARFPDDDLKLIFLSNTHSSDTQSLLEFTAELFL